VTATQLEKDMSEKLDVPRYMAAIMKLAGCQSKEGGIYVTEVAHDDWCAHWQNKPCNCNPVVSTQKVKE